MTAITKWRVARLLAIAEKQCAIFLSRVLDWLKWERGGQFLSSSWVRPMGSIAERLKYSDIHAYIGQRGGY